MRLKHTDIWLLKKSNSLYLSLDIITHCIYKNSCPCYLKRYLHNGIRVVSVGFIYKDGETGLEREGESCQCRIQIQRRRDRVRERGGELSV